MRHKLLSLFILTSIFFTTAAYSATYYVATNGSASGNGSSGSPWTLERAGEPGSNAAPASGDTVIVKNGTYTATVRGGFFFRRDGVKYQAETVGGVVVTNSAGYSSGQFNWGLQIVADNVTIEGFNVTNVVGCVDLDGAQGTKIHGCILHDTKTTASMFPASAGIYVEGGSTVTVTNSIIYNINKSSDQPGAGIYNMAGYNGSVSSSTYHHNDMYDINGYGIVVRGGNSNDKIYNNDFVRCRVGGVYVCAEGSSTAGSATVKNNAFVVIADANPESGGGTPPLKVQSGSTMTADYNLYAYTGGLDGIAIASHDVICGYNDVFTDWLHNDYSVPPGSYALDAGTAISGITDGYYGSAPDIGANEGKCTLTLHVYQESSLVPIMNKQIQFKQGSTVKGTATTDSNGKCTIDLAYGTYTVKVNDSNCVWQAYDSIDLDAVTKGTYDSPVNLPVYVRSGAATTFYVAADSDSHGNDYNSGLSRTSCWRTINNGEAKGIVRSGDTVVIMSGTHAVTGTGANLSHSGIIYKGESGTLVRNSTTVAGASTTTTSCFRVTAANVTIKDMEITGGVFGVEGASGSNGLTVENCTIHDTDYRDNWPCAAGVIVSAANAGITVKNNEIYNIGSGGKTGGAIARWTSGSATQSKYIGNYIHNITGNGFLFAYGSANDLVYQNTVVTASGQGVGALGSTSDGATCTVKNNIFSGCSGGAFLAQEGCTLTNSDNLVYNCGTSSGVTFGSNTIEADPLFGTAPALTALSPAVDSGANIGTTYWTPVGAGYDMGCREYAGTPNCVITGTITSDFASASPVSDATVTIGTVSATTDSNGTYSITVPRGNTYTFTVTADGYADYTGTSFAVGASDAALVKDAEMRAVCRIYGTVRSNSAVGGGVIPGATVSTTYGGSTYSTTTGADGTYSMVVPRHSQTVTITASAVGYRSASATSQPIWDAEKERNFNYMQAICTVSGTVTSSFDGRAVSGAAVTVGGESTTTAADGTYSVTLDRAASLAVSVSAAGYTTYTGTAAATTAAVTENITLTERGAVSGTITSAADGSPVSGATVTVAGNSATTGADGTYSVDVDRAASYNVAVSAEGFVGITDTVSDGGVPTAYNAALDLDVVPVASMAELLAADEGAYVRTDFDMVVTAATGTFAGNVIYAQSEDRLNGIKLIVDPEIGTFALGNRIRLIGTVSKVDGDTVLTAESVTKNVVGGAVPDTLGLVKSHLVNETLVRVWGKVTSVSGNVFTVFNGRITFTCRANSDTVPAVGDVVGVNGIATEDGILIRNAADIVTYITAQ